MARGNKNPGFDLVNGRQSASKEKVTAHAVTIDRRQIVLCETLKLLTISRHRLARITPLERFR
jgi:hypothetical protein